MYNYNQRGNAPSGQANAFGSRYQYQTLPYGFEGTQTGGLIGKVMGLLAFSFLFAAIGTFVSVAIGLAPGTYLLIFLASFVVLIALGALIQKAGLNLFLLYLFTFLQGMTLGPILNQYLVYAPTILTQAFLITAITSLGLGFYAWTTKRDFTRLGDYLFIGVILLLITSLIGFFFQSPLFMLIISFIGVAIFSGYVLYYVQRARYMADTMPNAIGLTVSLFLTVINLFLYILRILSILQGGNRRS